MLALALAFQGDASGQEPGQIAIVHVVTRDDALETASLYMDRQFIGTVSDQIAIDKRSFQLRIGTRLGATLVAKIDLDDDVPVESSVVVPVWSCGSAADQVTGWEGVIVKRVGTNRFEISIEPVTLAPGSLTLCEEQLAGLRLARMRRVQLYVSSNVENAEVLLDGVSQGILHMNSRYTFPFPRGNSKLHLTLRTSGRPNCIKVIQLSASGNDVKCDFL